MFKRINDASGGMFWFIMVMLLALAMAFVFMGCGVSLPVKDKDEPRICHMARMCMYLNQKNPDKSVCVDLWRKCSKIDTYEYCKNKDNRIDEVTFQSCLDKLN